MNKQFDPEKYLQNIEPESLTEDEKSTLWSRIDGTIGDRKQSRSAMHVFPLLGPMSWRFALVSLMVVFLATGSFATIAAADSAKPGDLLYPLDLATEKVRLVLSGSKKKQSLRLRFSKERLEETKLVLADSEEGDDQAAFEALDLPRNFNSKKIKDSEEALDTTLVYLNEIRGAIDDDDDAAEEIDEMIGELAELADGHLAHLGKFKAKIHNTDKKLSVAIDVSGKKVKNRFNFEGSAAAAAGARSGKVVICHIPPGDSSAAHTIEISGAALKAHLAHGDEVGACGDEGGDDDEDTTPPVISNIVSSAATNTAEVSWNTDEEADSTVWYGTLSAGSADMVLNHNVALSGLDASTTYYFVVVSVDASGNTATSSEYSFVTLAEEPEEPEDTTPPVRSNGAPIGTLDHGTTQTVISLDTDEVSICKYSVTAGADYSSMVNTFSSVGGTSHSAVVTGLSDGNTYNYYVRCEDGLENENTDDYAITFDVAVPPDTTPPEFSDITATNIASTSAQVSWTTDEDATSKVWYDIVSPFVVSTTTPFVMSTGLVLDHLLTLDGLTASTTYYYIVSSTDASDNTADSTEFSFTTLAE